MNAPSEKQPFHFISAETSSISDKYGRRFIDFLGAVVRRGSGGRQRILWDAGCCEREGRGPPGRTHSGHTKVTRRSRRFDGRDAVLDGQPLGEGEAQRVVLPAVRGEQLPRLQRAPPRPPQQRALGRLYDRRTKEAFFETFGEHLIHLLPKATEREEGLISGPEHS